MAVHEMAIDAHPSGSADCDVETAWHPIGRAEFKLEGHVRDGGIEWSIWLSAPGVGGELPHWPLDGRRADISADVCRDIGLGDAERTVHFGIRYPNKAAVLDLIARNQASAGRVPA